MHQIRVDIAHGLIEATLTGLMSQEDVSAYIADLRRMFVTHRLHDYAMIVDVSGCPIQPQETAKAMAAHMATMPKARAIGVVTGASPARMQVRRLFTQPYARLTATAAQARAWVIAGTEPVGQTVDARVA